MRSALARLKAFLPCPPPRKRQATRDIRNLLFSITSAQALAPGGRSSPMRICRVGRICRARAKGFALHDPECRQCNTDTSEPTHSLRGRRPRSDANYDAFHSETGGRDETPVTGAARLHCRNHSANSAIRKQACSKPQWLHRVKVGRNCSAAPSKFLTGRVEAIFAVRRSSTCSTRRALARTARPDRRTTALSIGEGRVF
jgi:hypothetical protein